MISLPGPRDHVVTASLQGELVALRDDQPVTKGLDSTEGPHRLARHAMLELRRYLETDNSAVSQTEKINRILREFDANDAEIVVPPTRPRRNQEHFEPRRRRPPGGQTGDSLQPK